MILESGEEILCGYARSIFKYYRKMTGLTIVPLNGDKNYTQIRNLYDFDRKQFVTYRAED